jgi:serine/threonine-protein kinase RsbW
MRIKMFYSKVSLQSDLSRLSEIEFLVEDIMRQFKIKEDFAGIISVPLNECVQNAVIHGNKCDKDKKVTVEVLLEKSKLSFSVTDEGQGFDYDAVLQKEIEQRKENGLLLVEMLTEDLSFSLNGSRVSYKVNVPFSLPVNEERIGVLKQSQEVVNVPFAV